MFDEFDLTIGKRIINSGFPLIFGKVVYLLHIQFQKKHTIDLLYIPKLMAYFNFDIFICKINTHKIHIHNHSLS